VRFAVGPLGEPALAAAARFHAEVLPRLPVEADLVLVFEPADHTHAGWRLAVIQQLARERAPRRINAIAGDNAPAIERVCEWLDAAPGVTGQYLPLAIPRDGHGAAPVVC
jgi:hypothetical protein